MYGHICEESMEIGYLCHNYILLVLLNIQISLVMYCEYSTIPRTAGYANLLYIITTVHSVHEAWNVHN